MSVQLLTTIAQVREYTASARRHGMKIGCVPTMGAMHAGHGSLMERARAESDTVVVTIFVNPIQFDRKDDYERYTKSLDSDIKFCEARDVDVVFAPSVDKMYPEPVSISSTLRTWHAIFAVFRAQGISGAWRPW